MPAGGPGRILAGEHGHRGPLLPVRSHPPGLAHGARRGLRALRRSPSQAPGDHQVEHQEELPLERQHDPFAEAPDPGDSPPLGGAQGRLEGPQEERAGEADPLEGAAGDEALEGLDVDGGIG